MNDKAMKLLKDIAKIQRYDPKKAVGKESAKVTLTVPKTLLKKIDLLLMEVV